MSSKYTDHPATLFSLMRNATDVGMAVASGYSGSSSTEEPDEYNLNQNFHYIKFKEILCPQPICAGHGQQTSGFHILFKALEDPDCKITRFHLNHCINSKQAEYFSCLGETIGKNTTIKSLKVSNMIPESTEPDIKYLMPLIYALR